MISKDLNEQPNGVIFESQILKQEENPNPRSTLKRV